MLYGSEETLIGKPSMSLGSSEASIVQKSLQVWYKNQCDKQNERQSSSDNYGEQHLSVTQL